MQALLADVPADKTLSPPRNAVAHAWITSQQFVLLEAHARRRRIHPDRLLAAIADRVLVHGIVDLILDELPTTPADARVLPAG